MGPFAVGDVVLVPFPYADFSQLKKRPALVVAAAEFDNLVLCQITSKSGSSQRAITLEDADFQAGGLRVTSYVRPDKLFTLEQSVIEGKAGCLEAASLDTVKTALRQLFA